MTKTIDLNADLGEGERHDAAIMPLISSCNIACGGHAGDPASMAQTLDLAARHEVRCGAHPSYPDRAGFGRRTIKMGTDDLKHSLNEQIGRLAALAYERGQHLTHLKPHGALYDDAAQDEGLADLVLSCAASLGFDTQLIGPPDSALERAASRAGLRFVSEGFIDRAYASDGSLVPRDKPGAVLSSLNARLKQALSLIQTGRVSTQSGESIDLPAQTLCLHGDSDSALETAIALRALLEERSISVAAPS